MSGEAKDGAEVDTVLEIITQAARELSSAVGRLREHALSGPHPPHKGLSLLSVKNHQLLDYIINIVHLVSVKVAGGSIQGHPAILRLAEIRTVLERIRPMEKKLEYQVDKLLRVLAAPDAVEAADDALFHKPRLENLAGSSDSEVEEDEETGKKERRQGRYQPPKLLAVPYEESGPAGEEKKEKEKRKQRLSRSMIADLAAQYGDAPEELHEEEGSGRRAERLAASRRKTTYEEDNFVRLQASKKERDSTRRAQTASLEGLLGWADFGEFGDRPKKRRASDQGKGGKVKRKGSFKKKSRKSK